MLTRKDQAAQTRARSLAQTTVIHLEFRPARPQVFRARRIRIEIERARRQFKRVHGVDPEIVVVHFAPDDSITRVECVPSAGDGR